MEQQSRFARVLQRSEKLTLVFFYGALLLLETGYVAWLERLPDLPRAHEAAGLFSLPLWYERPRAEVTLLLTLVGGFLAWSGISLLSMFWLRSDEAKQVARNRLITTAFYTALAGGNLLSIHLLDWR
jgi:hypothetical protein